MDYKAEVLTALRKFEGVVPWMYLDTLGLVTTGIGNLLPNVMAAYKLPWLLSNMYPTDRTKIYSEYTRVKAMEAGHMPPYYKGDLFLTPDSINSLVSSRLDEFEYQLSKAMDYLSQPDPAKAALLEMTYVVGVGGIMKFSHLMKSLEHGDYMDAAQQCQIAPGNSAYDARNEWAKQMFLLAAKS